MLQDLLLLRRLQITMKEETEKFFAKDPTGTSTPVSREILDRLTHRQSNIRSLFDRFLEKANPQGGNEDTPDGPESRPGEGR